MIDDELKQMLAELNESVQRELDDENLINWLARTYEGNDPIFPFQGADGELLNDNINLYRTWQRVVNAKSFDQIEYDLRNILGDLHQEQATPGKSPEAT